MGCDIHLLIEKKVDGVWRPACGKIKTCDRYRWTESEQLMWDEPFSHRAYDVFAILANVRNGSGFAGCYTGSGFVPICEPRGLPDDVCAEYRNTADGFWFGDHSHSWLSLRDLLAFDYTQETVKTGWVSWKEYVRWARQRDLDGIKNCYPDGWSGDVSGPGIDHVPADEFEKEFQKLTRDQKNEIARETYKHEFGGRYASITWPVTYARVIRDFIELVVLPMLAIKNSGGLSGDDVRIVFGFDS